MKHLKRKVLLLPLLFLGLLVNAGPVRDKYVAVELVPEVSSVSPGDTFTVALKVEMDSGWHTYWKNPGIGMPTKIKWTLPEGVTASDIKWPTPHAYSLDGAVNYGYADEAWLLTDITVPKGMSGQLDLNAKVSWLMCKESCVPGRAKISTSVVIGSTKINDSLKAKFASARSHIPEVADSWKLVGKKASDDKSLTVVITPPDCFKNELKDVYFFSGTKKMIDTDAKQTLTKTSNGYELKLVRGKKPLPEVLSGILYAKEGINSPASAYTVNIKI